jgi:4-hydroxythreonine-4-phosphate dehydrogenase
MEKLKIGISIGDINGIGLEVILKTLGHPRITQICTPVVYGSSKVVSYHKNIVDKDFDFFSVKERNKINDDKVNVINCWQENVNITLGAPSVESGQFAIRSLEAATIDLKEGFIDALVTAPISKEAIKMADFPFPGHTEYLADKLSRGEESLMLMVNDDLRVGLVTGHIPISEVPKSINKKLVINKIKAMHLALKMDFGIEKPTIAVLGLNPHAGDGGVLGSEEEEIIRPAVIELKKKGILAMGPFAADGLFGSGNYKKYDGIVAMYHDQGLIPFKALSFGSGVNFTAGLSCVRTSPDHGTAFDLAGKNMASPSSFRQALYLALDITRNRHLFMELQQNAIGQLEKPAEVEGEDEALNDE